MTDRTYRYRSRGVLRPAGSWNWWNYVGSTSSGSSLSVGTTEWMADYVTNRFRKRSASGEVIMNQLRSFKRVRASAQVSDLYAASNYPTANPMQWARQSGNCMHQVFAITPSSSGMGFTSITDADWSAARVEAATRCLSQANRGDTNNWENIAELSKTIQMLRHPITSWWTFDRKRKIYYPGVSAANLWLQYRYGIRPLISSTDAILRSLYRNIRPLRKTTRASSVVSKAPSRTYVSTANGWYAYTIEERITESVECRAMSIDEVATNRLPEYGLATKDLLTLPWELIPYSFVVDWFVNVGDYIGALANCLYPSALGSCLVQTTTISKYEAVVSQVGWGLGSNITVFSPNAGWVRMDEVAKYRDPGLGAPGLVVKSDFRLDDVTRIADSFGLIAQRIASLFGRF